LRLLQHESGPDNNRQNIDPLLYADDLGSLAESEDNLKTPLRNLNKMCYGKKNRSTCLEENGFVSKQDML
jgi:hypothetical protein